MYLYVYALEGILLGPKECALKFGLRDLDLKNFARFSSFFFFFFCLSSMQDTFVSVVKQIFRRVTVKREYKYLM